MTTAFRILLVEDDSSIAKLIEIGMRDLGVPYQIDQAISAEEGLELWNKNPYDLLLTDYNLRGMTGLALISTLKSQNPSIPTILFTAYDSPQLRKEARNLHVSAFIPKPFFVDQFIHVARGLLSIKPTGS